MEVDPTAVTVLLRDLLTKITRSGAFKVVAPAVTALTTQLEVWNRAIEAKGIADVRRTEARGIADSM